MLSCKLTVSNRWNPSRLANALLLLCPILLILAADHVTACCPVFPPNTETINGDQTVLIIWDPETQTQHFIRKASFRVQGDDFGFVVPTPNQPELGEVDNKIFTDLFYTTRINSRSKSAGVTVLEQKEVAGYDASVLDAASADALAGWLKDHGFVDSPEVKNWAAPYVEEKWKFTALKFAKDTNATSSTVVNAKALRLSFKTDHPLFPYREPDSKKGAAAFGVNARYLRIYFISNGRYEGQITPDHPWSGQTYWSGPLGEYQGSLLAKDLNLPPTTIKPDWWITAFHHNWPYQVAPADLYFVRSENQNAFNGIQENPADNLSY